MKLLRVHRYEGDWSATAALAADQDRLAAAVGADWYVDLVVVDDDEMRRLNRDFRGKDAVTDVLSFSNLEEMGDAAPELCAGDRGAAVDLWEDRAPGGAEASVGEIIMAPDFIRERCEREGWPLDDEFAMLTVHGLLHILGWDHQEPEPTRRMRALERELLATCGRNHPLDAEEGE